MSVLKGDIKLLNGINSKKVYRDSTDLYTCIGVFGLGALKYITVDPSVLSAVIRAVTTQQVPIPGVDNDVDILSAVNRIIVACTEMTELNVRNIISNPEVFEAIRELILSMYIGIVSDNATIDGYRESIRSTLDTMIRQYGGNLPMHVNSGLMTYSGVTL